MKQRLFVLSALLVGLALAWILVFEARPATARIQQFSVPAPTPIFTHVQVTVPQQTQITSVVPITDVGQFVSGARYCDADCRAALGLSGRGEWPVPSIGTGVGAAIPCAFPLPDGMCVYRGDLHSHTGYSDGEGTPEQAYQMARSNGLDFFATTDHAEQLSGSEWADTLVQARAATVEDHFIALRGFEWTSDRGHLNVFNTDNRVRATDPQYNGLNEFYAWLSDPAQINSVAQFNHPYYPPDPFRNWRYNALADLHINLTEVHHRQIQLVGEYNAALAAGWHVGAASNSDTHEPNWGEWPGRTGILAPALTYHHVINALRARRTFSPTDDENLTLVMRADGYWMGSVVRDGPFHFDIYAFDPEPDDLFTTLELYRNGSLVQGTVVKTNTVTWSFTLLTPSPPGAWWYAKATQGDGDEAYTSPVWTHRPEPYDVLIRDNAWDVGDVPSNDSAWQSPDIWVRRQADGNRWHENPVAGEINHVYARVQNIGTNPLTDVDVHFYWTDPSLGFIWPDSWQPITSPVRIHNLAPGKATVVSVPWDASDSIPRHACLLVRLVSSQDPIHYEGYPKWDNNIGWRNVHILDANDLAPPGTLTFEGLKFYLVNPFAEDGAVDVRISSADFPAEGAITLYLDAELFDRWIVTDTSGLVKGAVIDPISRTITITSPADAAVYGLPLQAEEISTATLVLYAPPTSTLSVRVSEEIDGEEIGGNLYATSHSDTPKKISLEAAAEISVDEHVGITAVVVGDGFVPVADGTEVRLSTTLGSLSTDTVQTRNGIVTATLSAGKVPGTAIVQAGTSGLVSATAVISVHPTCWVRLNDDPFTYLTIQEAVDASTHPTDVVKVAGRCTTTNTRGGLVQVVYISKTVTIRGGYTVTNWTTADPMANPTTLDAKGQGRVLYITDPTTGSVRLVGPTIEGLHITGGDAGNDVGGGVCIVSVTAIIRNNWMFSNTAGTGGGGVSLSSGDVTLINNVVADNQADGLGGGLHIEGGLARMLHTTIVRNGSGIYVTNRGAHYSTVGLTNTVVASHTVGITVTAGNTATLESTLWGSGTWANGTDWGGGGAILTSTRNAWGDPAFVDPGAGNYHIGPGSAALDTGVDAGVSNDVDGDLRPMGHGYDVGADELRIGLMVTKHASPGPVRAGTPMTYTIRVINTGDLDLHAIVTDTLPTHITSGKTADGTVITPGGTITWTPVVTAPGSVWTQQVVVTVALGYAKPLTNVVQVTTAEGAAGIYTHTLVLTPGLEIVKRAAPDPVDAGEPLVYTVYVTNTGNLDLHVTVTDTLPTHIMSGTVDGETAISPGGTITWTPIVTAPGGVWEQRVVLTAEVGYVGTLTNVVQARADEGALDVYTETSSVVVVYPLYLPVAMRNFSPPVPCAPRLLAEVETGPEPYMVALDMVGRRAFVAYADGVTVIDMNRFTIITATHSPTLAHGIAYDPDRDHIWVTRRNPDRVIVLDGATYASLADLPAGEAPHSIAYNPANSRVYITNYWSETVMVYDAETLAVVEVLTGFGEPAHLAVNPVSNKVYVANHEPNRGVIAIDGATHDVYPIGTTLLDAYGVAVDTTRNLVYAMGIAQGRVVIIDGDTDAQVGELDIRNSGGQAVWLRVIAVNPNVGPEGHLLLVTSSNDGEPDQLLLIPNGWPTLGTPVPLDIASYPQEGITVDLNQDRVWVTSVSSGLVSVIQDGEPVCSP